MSQTHIFLHCELYHLNITNSSGLFFSLPCITQSIIFLSEEQGALPLFPHTILSFPLAVACSLLPLFSRSLVLSLARSAPDLPFPPLSLSFSLSLSFCLSLSLSFCLSLSVYFSLLYDLSFARSSLFISQSNKSRTRQDKSWQKGCWGQTSCTNI